ncbi:MAG: glycosyl hydrolase family 28-related protein [Polyangiales bacterium]
MTRARRRYRLPSLLAALLLASVGWLPRAAAQAFPRDSGVIDVRAFGARGDGVHDDTSALLAAIGAARVRTKFFWPTRVVYLPAGRYLVRDTLRSLDPEQHYQAQLALIGDGPTQTTIVLADETPGFHDPRAPKAVIFTTSGLRSGDPSAGGKRYLELGEGNDAYANYVEGLAIDVGHNNAGAIAIDYLANNIGAVRNVALRAPSGSGAIGIAMERRWPGPLLVSDVSIDGFDVGIAIKHLEYGVTLQHVQLRGQHRVALRNSGNLVAMRDVHFETPNVGIINDDVRGLIVADELRYVATDKHAIFARNVGYLTLGPTRQAPQGQLGVFEAGGTFLGETPLPQFGSEWKLPSPPRVLTPQRPVQEWANVTTFGAQPYSDQDASAAIQAALSSGAAVVYLPTGRYTIDRPLEVPSSVQHIEGMMSVLTIGNRVASFGREQGMLRVASGGQPLTINRLTLDNMDKGAQIGVEQLGPRSLVLRDFIGGGVSVCRRELGGPLVLENTIGPLNLSGPANVWASQLNIEGQGTLIRNRGTPLSILGIKVEQNATVVENRDNGQVEILGGLFYMVSPAAQARPALTNSGGGRVFAAYGESAYRPGAIYVEHMVQFDADIRHVTVRAEDLPARGPLGRISPGRTLRGPQQ